MSIFNISGSSSLFKTPATTTAATTAAADTKKAAASDSKPLFALAYTNQLKAGDGDSVQMSALAKRLNGTTLELFNNLEAKDRKALNNLVESGRMTADEVHFALKDLVKQSRSQAYGESGMMFTHDNPDYMGDPEAATTDSMIQTVTSHLARRKAMVGQLLKMEEDGQTGTEDYTKLKFALSGQRTEAELAEQKAKDPFAKMKALQDSFTGSGSGSEPSIRATPEQVERLKALQAEMPEMKPMRIITPYGMSLGDSRYARTHEEKNASEKLARLGFKSESFDRAVRATGEKLAADDVEGNIDWLAGVMNGTPSARPTGPYDPEFNINDWIARIK